MVDYASEVEVGKDVGVVHQERFVAVEQRLCAQNAAAGVEQLVALVADGYVYAKVILFVEKLNNLVAEMMYVHHHLGDAASNDVFDYTLKHRHPVEWHQCFWHGVGEWFQSGA